MPAGYALALSLTATGITAAPLAVLRTNAAEGIRLRELWMWNLNGPGTSADIALFRATNTPVATTSTLGQAEDPGSPVSTTNIDTAWSTAPTVGTLPLRATRNTMASNFNCDAFHWHEQGGLVVPPGSYLVLWQNGAVSSALQVLTTFVWEE